MLGYNGSIPGPTLHVDQGSEVTIESTNDGDLDATVHWHGLRLENRTTAYRTRPRRRSRSAASSPTASSSPTPACTGTTRTSARTTPRRWACTATSSSSPPNPDYWPPVEPRSWRLTLDDILIEDGKIAAFSRSRDRRYTAMGRFGNVMLISGETDLALRPRSGEVVRLYVDQHGQHPDLQLRLPGARMKLVGGDSGRVEREEFIDEVLLAPSERAVVDVLLRQARRVGPGKPHPGPHLRAGHDHRRGEELAEPSLTEQFRELRVDPELAAERGAPRLDRARARQDLAFVCGDADLYGSETSERGRELRLPDASRGHRASSRSCPKCGMKLLATGPVTHPAVDRMVHTPAGNAHQQGHHAGHHVMEHHGMDHEGKERGCGPGGRQPTGPLLGLPGQGSGSRFSA